MSEQVTIATEQFLAFAAGVLFTIAEQRLGTKVYREKCIDHVCVKQKPFTLDFLLKMERDINFDLRRAGLAEVTFKDGFRAIDAVRKHSGGPHEGNQATHL
jgi:hypothetical protein